MCFLRKTFHPYVHKLTANPHKPADNARQLAAYHHKPGHSPPQSAALLRQPAASACQLWCVTQSLSFDFSVVSRLLSFECCFSLLAGSVIRLMISRSHLCQISSPIKFFGISKEQKFLEYGVVFAKYLFCYVL